MANYNLSFMDTSNNLADIWTGVSSMTGEGFGIAITVLIFFVTFASAKTFDSNVRFILSSFLTTVIAGLMFFAGWVVWWVAIIPAVLLIISIILDFFKK